MPRVGFRRGSFTRAERRFVRATLVDARGWAGPAPAGAGVAFRFRGAHPVDVVFALCDGVEMERRFGHLPHLRGLSVTDSGSHPAHIFLHRGNWERPPAAFTGTRDVYRAYVVQHEVAHAVLGRGHAAERTDGGACRVMHQQTRGTPGCAPNAWVAAE